MSTLFQAAQVPQDLHIHTVFSTGDSSIVQEQTLMLISKLNYARITGIADHLSYVTGQVFKEYEQQVRSFNFKVGVEVGGAQWIEAALAVEPDYYVYHCRNTPDDYDGVNILLQKGIPLIIAHPFYFGANLDKIPEECLVEINNRYIWRIDWKKILPRYVDKFRFVIGSDAHQPNWLNQNVARYIAKQLGIEETILFSG